MNAKQLSLCLFAAALLGAGLACNLPKAIPTPTLTPLPQPSPTLPLPSPGASSTPTPPPTPLPRIESPTLPMLPPTNTPIPPTASPTALPTHTPTTSPTPSQTATAGHVISDPTRSSDLVYYNNSGCGPTELTLSIIVSDPQAYSVFLFVRLKEKTSDAKTDWNSGIPMIPQGGGKFQVTLSTEKIPGYTSYAEAWLQYQFVATDSQQNNLARSTVYADITLSKCP
jgi:hypothetical protein